MARKSRKKKVEEKKYRFFGWCCECGKKYESDECDGLPCECCGHAITYNDSSRMRSDFLKILCKEVHGE